MAFSFRRIGRSGSRRDEITARWPGRLFLYIQIRVRPQWPILIFFLFLSIDEPP